MLFGVCGALALAWLTATALGIIGPGARGAASVLLFGGLAGAAGVVLIVRRTMRRVGTPLRDVMEAAERVADGDYSVRVTEQGPPAIHGLTRAFNTMAERLQRHDRLRRDLMADVAHELRTPLAVIQGKLEGLLDDIYPRDDGHLTELLEEAHVLSRLIEDLRTLALSDSGALKLQKDLTDLGALAAEATRTVAAGARARGVAVGVEAAASLPPVSVDPVRIREVLTNLLSNAIRHTPAGGSVTVRVAFAGNGGVQIVVQDTGSGMAPEDIERAFERFHKGPESRGAGLGLSIARSLIVAHGGEIQASSAPGRGTAMTITLPKE